MARQSLGVADWRGADHWFSPKRTVDCCNLEKRRAITNGGLPGQPVKRGSHFHRFKAPSQPLRWSGWGKLATRCRANWEGPTCAGGATAKSSTPSETSRGLPPVVSGRFSGTARTKSVSSGWRKWQRQPCLIGCTLPRFKSCPVAPHLQRRFRSFWD